MPRDVPPAPPVVVVPASGPLAPGPPSPCIVSVFESRAIDGAAGWLLSGYAGWQEGIGDDPSSFARYGADLQRFIDLYRVIWSDLREEVLKSYERRTEE